MKKIDKVRGRFLDMFFDNENRYIALIKVSEVNILNKHDFSLFKRISMKDCIYGTFYKDKIILASVSKINVFNVFSDELVFSKKVKCIEPSKYILSNDFLMCVNDKNRIVGINLLDYSFVNFDVPDFCYLSIQKYNEKLLVAYKISQYSDKCEVALFDENFKLVEKYFSFDAICVLTLKVVNDAVFYVENGYVVKYDLKKKQVNKSVEINFLPLVTKVIQNKYLLTNYIYTNILDDELNIVKENISNSFMDFHTIGADEEHIYICKNNGIYID